MTLPAPVCSATFATGPATSPSPSPSLRPALGALATGDLDAARIAGLTLDGDAAVLQELLGVLQPGDPAFTIVEP
jgi:Alkyl sulfatase C-terminal